MWRATLVCDCLWVGVCVCVCVCVFVCGGGCGCGCVLPAPCSVGGSVVELWRCLHGTLVQVLRAAARVAAAAVAVSHRLQADLAATGDVPATLCSPWLPLLQHMSETALTSSSSPGLPRRAAQLQQWLAGVADDQSRVVVTALHRATAAGETAALPADTAAALRSLGCHHLANCIGQLGDGGGAVRGQAVDAPLQHRELALRTLHRALAAAQTSVTSRGTAIDDGDGGAQLALCRVCIRSDLMRLAMMDSHGGVVDLTGIATGSSARSSGSGSSSSSSSSSGSSSGGGGGSGTSDVVVQQCLQCVALARECRDDMTLLVAASGLNSHEVGVGLGSDYCAKLPVIGVDDVWARVLELLLHALKTLVKRTSDTQVCTLRTK